MTRIRPDDAGVALIVTLLAMALMMALGMALVLPTMTESRIASAYRDGTAALYAADAAIERSLRDVLVAADVSRVLDGTLRSTFVDGQAGGARALPGGGTIDLTEETDAVREVNPLWQLYAQGPIADLRPGELNDVRIYVAVWVADGALDPADGAVISMLAHAYGPGGVRRAVEARVARTEIAAGAPSAVHILSWRERR